MNDETKQQFKVKIADAVNYCGIDAETDTPDERMFSFWYSRWRHD